MISLSGEWSCCGRFLKLISILIFSLLLISCGTKSRYAMEHDIGPKGSFDASNVPDAIPVWEPISRQGNASPYVVRGKTYRIADVSNGFEESGYASWYGLKFHGELTSNGEIYNMYAMSAAHKNLPIPSYVKVTNLENNKQVVVRVNDRGPFHKGRVIDLSYAAATKLGFAKKGTAKVKLELIRSANKSEAEDKVAYFIQVAAFSNKESAQNLSNEIERLEGVSNVFIGSALVGDISVHRLRIGPYSTEADASVVISLLKSKGYSGTQLIQRALTAKNI